MDRLREKIQELKDRFDSSLQKMLEMEEQDIHRMPLHINLLNAQLRELSREVDRVIRDSFKEV